MSLMVPYNSQFNFMISHPIPNHIDGEKLLYSSHGYLKNSIDLAKLPVTAAVGFPIILNSQNNVILAKTNGKESSNITYFSKKDQLNRLKRTSSPAFQCPLKLNDLRTKIPVSNIIFNREILDQVNRSEVDVNTQDKDNRTALMASVLLGNGLPDIARLLQKGAELDYLDSDGNTALVLAIMTKENAIINALLKAGANVNLAGNMALTPLMLAVLHNDFKLVDKLATKGIKPDVKNDDEDTALTLALKNGVSGKVIDSLLRLGCGVNVPGKDGLAPLLLAAGNGNKMFLKKILPLGADIDALDNKGWTALMRAVACGNQNIMKYLVERGAAVNIKDPNNITALSLALDRGHKTMIKILRKAGATEGRHSIRHQRPTSAAPQTTLSTANAPIATSWPAGIVHTSTILPYVDVGSTHFYTTVEPARSGSSDARLNWLPEMIISSIKMIFNSVRQYMFRRRRT
ncbi:ankyrin repeat domain-containing protein [Sodalis ligni]|uniref:Ankyrin repeat protein n=1 Tax=Sodalis ligni TaxID=2697027 RepID=A0A4R1NPB1_9GAMM|nr:ankyrin repeat domain-containing protein [Sodalis ligni]TCL06546.1 ankyrin repeat protein [Sodalis ligni]